MVDAFRRLVRELRSSAAAAQRRAGLSAARLFVLQQLRAAGTPLSLGELAERTLTHQSSVSVVVQRLVEARLVTRGRAADDGRRLEVSLTPRARALLRRSPQLFQERLITGVGALPPSRRKGLADGLLALVDELGLSGAPPAMFFEERS